MIKTLKNNNHICELCGEEFEEENGSNNPHRCEDCYEEWGELWPANFNNKYMNEEIIKKIESQEKSIEMLCKRIDIAHERIDAIREMVENLKK